MKTYIYICNRLQSIKENKASLLLMLFLTKSIFHQIQEPCAIWSIDFSNFINEKYLYVFYLFNFFFTTNIITHQNHILSGLRDFCHPFQINSVNKKKWKSIEYNKVSFSALIMWDVLLIITFSDQLKDF